MTNLRKALPLILFIVVALWTLPATAQTPPDCTFSFTFTGDATQTGVSNLSSSTPCANWRVTFTTTGTLATTVTFQTSPDNITFTSVPNTVCSSSVQPPCIFQGTNPLTGTAQGMTLFASYGNYVRVTTSSSSGTGTGSVRAYGAKGASAAASVPGGNSGGATIPATTNLLKGDGAGNAADSLIVPSTVPPGKAVLCQDATGSTSTTTCPSATPTVTAYANIGVLVFVPQASGAGGAMTVNVLNLGPVAIKDSDCSTNLGSSSLVGGKTYLLAYIAPNFCLASGSSTSSGGGQTIGTATCPTVSTTATCALATNSLLQFTLAANTTLVNTGAVSGATYVYDITNDSTCRTITYPGNMATAPAMPCITSGELIFSCVYDGTTMKCGSGIVVNGTPGWIGPTDEAAAPSTSVATSGVYVIYGDSTLHVPCGMENANSTKACMLKLSGGDLSGTPSAVVVSQVNGGAVAISAPIAATNGSGQIIAAGAQYRTVTCQPGLGDGLNAITAGTYLQSTCLNAFGVTWTITSIKCFTDNNGTSTLNVTNGAGTALLTGAITCTNSWASGTQSGTTTIASGDYPKFTFVADGTSKQTTWAFTGTK